MSFSFLSRAAIAAVVLIASACGPSGSPPGEDCYSDSECSSGLCRINTCVASCATDEDCTAINGSCGADGYCLPGCDEERATDYSGAVCVDGHWATCDSLDESYCDVCDGLCPGQRCVAEVGCAPLAMVGEECAEDSDCNTNHCSSIAGVCRVPVGAACDATNCDRCLSNGDWSYCSRECGAQIDVECPNQELCLGDTDTNFFWCRPSCEGCPGSCEYGADYTVTFCDADWTISSPPREELQPCHNDGQCAEGVCISAPSCDSRSYTCAGRRGYCSGACTSDADCGAAGRCVEVPCADGATTGCGNVCLPACDPDEYQGCNPLADASCRALPSVDGGEATVCDPRSRDGAYCTRGAHCLSGTCSSEHRCVPAGGAANGASCSVDADCASSNCQSGTCRGTSLRGQACTSNYDCSVGSCVDGVCD